LQSQIPTMKKAEDILKTKEALAGDALKVATEALGYIEDALPDAGIRDLINIFNSAIKTHRDLCGDILDITAPKESEKEKELAKEYSSKVDDLLKKFSS
jgi:hypothetical protein